ncbi:MAG TPA: hypothetical protein VF185_04425 [Patescibacteria group bacterium]
MTNLNLKLFFIFLFANIWIWKILHFNFFIFTAVLAATFFIYKSVKEKKINKIFIISMLILIAFQFATTKTIPLVQLGDQEKLYQIQRLKEYPPVYIKIFNKNLWIPTANWFENKPWLLSIYRIKNNVSDALSLNLYFFSNHPNERVGFKEFEKFPYILLPFFVIGFLNFDYKKEKKIFFLSFAIPIFLIGLIGQSNPIGPFVLFPFIFLSILSGVKYVYEKIKVSKVLNERIVVGLFIVCYLLVFVQTIIYATL